LPIEFQPTRCRLLPIADRRPRLADNGQTILDQRRGLGDARPMQPGRAFLFDGVDDYLDVFGKLTTAKTSHSLSMWAKSTENGNLAYLYDQHTTPRFVLARTTGTGNIGWYDGTWRHLASLTNDGKWHHITFA
jgi:hypothetical protein